MWFWDLLWNVIWYIVIGSIGLWILWSILWWLFSFFDEDKTLEEKILWVLWAISILWLIFYYREDILSFFN